MDYIEVEIHGKTIRYFSEHHIEFEFYNVKGNWKKVAIGDTGKGYKSFQINFKRNRHNILIHRLVFFICNPRWNIYDKSKDNTIDHFDGDPLNNNIANLRCVTQQENTFNRTKAKGYHWHKASNKWLARIRVGGKTIYLGLFDKEENARNAYLEAKPKFHIIKGKVF